MTIFRAKQFTDYRFGESAVATLIAVLLSASYFLSAWTATDARAFDQMSTLFSARPATPGVIIVAIDEASLADIGEQWPWPRRIHARLLDSLRTAGVRAVAVDILFAEPSDPVDDSALTAATNADVVLAASEQVVERSFGTQIVRTQPLQQLIAAGARPGVASLSRDGDGILRLMPTYRDSLGGELVGRSLGSTGPPPALVGQMIQYLGPHGTYPTISYYQALDAARMLPPGYLRNKVVIVGLALQTDVTVKTQSADAFETPYTARDGQLTAGVEVQATIYDNLYHQLAIRDQPAWWPYFAIAIGAIFAGFSTKTPSLLRRVCIVVCCAGVAITMSWLTLRFGRLWLSPVMPVVALAAVSLGLALMDYVAEQARRRQVQSAFGRYLSPTMVQQIVDYDQLPALGGDSRDMTVMFADIRGFTALSEILTDDPQKLIGVINAVMTPLSHIVFDNGGTIDKYIGDCLMAFWNAPLDDADHPAHAIQAARAMLDAMPAINNAIARDFPHNPMLPPINIGIGINTGTCVVGNMGSDSRFDYSVIGDTVNIAARLEGLCKPYGVGLVVGAGTRDGLPDDLPWVELGEVSVRGRKGVQYVYSLRQ